MAYSRFLNKITKQINVRKNKMIVLQKIIENISYYIYFDYLCTIITSYKYPDAEIWKISTSKGS
jgi:hypothetical protein